MRIFGHQFGYHYDSKHPCFTLSVCKAVGALDEIRTLQGLNGFPAKIPFRRHRAKATILNPTHKRIQELKQLLAESPEDRVTLSELIGALADIRRASQVLDLLPQLEPYTILDVELLRRVVSMLTAGAHLEKGLALAESLMALSPDDTDLLMQLGSDLMVSKQFSAAAEVLGKVIALEPRNSVALRFRSSALLQAGQADLAIADAARCLELAPENSEFRIHFGGLLLQSKQFKDAQLNLEKAIEIDPTNAHAHNLLSSVFVSMGLIGRAIDEATAAVKLEPALVSSQVHLAICSRYMAAIDKLSMCCAWRSGPSRKIASHDAS